MPPEIGDLQQRLSNLLRVGRVVAVQYNPPRASVQFGENVTALLPWLSGRAGSVKEWSPPAVGEQVLIACPSGEIDGGVIVCGGIPSSANPAPGSAGNKYVLTLPESGTWEIVIGNTKVELAQGSFKATVDGAELLVTPDKLTFNKDVEITGDVTVTGGIQTTMDVVAGTVSLQTHTHSGVEAGGSNTGPPAA